ncbi:DUF3846 domain-containing protein [Candidatus Jorgensenbacteria bacterium]|nr:DUF3846 domain-containing protein [Candidatus Jorgensenbacteria bacterium]
MKKALLIMVSGEKKIVFPKKKSGFDYEELRGYVGGIVQMVPMPKGRRLICHDEGKLIGLPKNEEATKIWKAAYPIEDYSLNNDELVVGDVLITGRNIEELLK